MNFEKMKAGWCSARLRLVVALVVTLVTIPIAASADQDAVIEAVRPIDRQTPLVVGGRPPALLRPAAPAYDEAAAQLVAGLAAMGVHAEEVSGIDQADPASRTVICLGSMLDNPLIERLYWNRYTFVDALHLGSERYLLHAVYDPYPYNGGHNVIIIGCSDRAGAQHGVRRFLSLIKDGRFPYVVEAGPESMMGEAETSSTAAQRPDSFVDFLRSANRYLQTGSEVYAREAVAALEVMANRWLHEFDHKKPPGTSAYQRLPYKEEVASWEINCAWDAFEECPLISDTQRLRFANTLLRFTRELKSFCSGYAAIDERYLITWNHTSYPLIGMHFGARYFDRYHHLPDMPEVLKKAKLCFTAQSRSWKPQEDGDTYVLDTMGAVWTYALAENQMDFFTTGQLQRLADYIAAICDNRGRSSGFGDTSSLLLQPFLPAKVLPLALWWTRDGSYRWLMDRYTGGKWQNPYERGVAPVQADRLTGVKAFAMDPHVYEFMQTQSSYGEPTIRSEVRAEEAFDKITFRENWDPQSQYLVLDGLARGKHLHYDGNAIITFVEGGECWLVDHDYLTQKTTEHTMLSILRDGRCSQQIPSLAGLAFSSDLPGAGYTRTYVKDYNGCDWERRILWRKGGWFLVADTVSPRASGHYTFDLTWKTIDHDGNQYVNARGDFVGLRGIGEERNRHCYVIDDPKASGGKALQFDNNNSRMNFALDLPAGDYAVTAVGANHPVRISVGREGEQVITLPSSRFYSPENGGEKSASLSLKGKGPHAVQVSCNWVGAPVRIDQFIFEDTSGKQHVYEAEDLQPAPPASWQLGRQLHIKSVDPVNSWVHNHQPEGISVAVCTLQQRQEGIFPAGHPVQFASLMFTSRPEARRDLQPVRVGGNLVAIQGSDSCLVLLGDVDFRGLRATVEGGILDSQRFTLSGLRNFQAGDLALSSSVPVDLVLELDTGKMQVHASQKSARIDLVLAGRTQRLSVESGRSTVQVENFHVPAHAIELITALMQTPLAPEPDSQRTVEPSPSDRPAWTALEGHGQIACVKAADLADGRGQRLLVCRDRTLYCLSSDGRLSWSFDAAGRATDVAFGELRPSLGQEIVLGSSDAHIYLLSATGELLEKRLMQGTQYAQRIGGRPFGVYNVGVWDVDGDGRNEIAVTLRSWELQLLSADFQPRWQQHYSLHGSKQLSFEDLDCDGKPETLLLGDRYGNCMGVSPEGNLVYSGRTSIGEIVYVTTTLDGGRSRHVVSGSSSGDLIATRVGRGARPLWRFDNFGYAVNRLRAADLDGDGQDEIIVASSTGYLYVLDASGQVKWRDRVGHSVIDALVIDAPAGLRVAYCDENGLVRLADGAGRSVRELRPPAPARSLTRLPQAGRVLLAMALSDGRVAAYEVR